MRYSVVFGVTLRLLVINISSSSLAINNAAYYQRCVTTSGTLAAGRWSTVDWVEYYLTWLDSVDNTWLVAALTAGTKARYRLRIAISADYCLPHLHSTPPLGGFPSEYRHPVWYGKTRMVWLSDGEKISKICLFILTLSMNVADKRTDALIHSIARQKSYSSYAQMKNGPVFMTHSVEMTTVLLQNIASIFAEVTYIMMMKHCWRSRFTGRFYKIAVTVIFCTGVEIDDIMFRTDS